MEHTLKVVSILCRAYLIITIINYLRTGVYVYDVFWNEFCQRRFKNHFRLDWKERLYIKYTSVFVMVTADSEIDCQLKYILFELLVINE